MNHLPSRFLVAITTLCSVASAPVAAPWTLRDSNAIAEVGYAHAIQVDNAGGEIRVFRDDRARVFLEFKISPGFDGFSRSSCPTFQIDRRMPMHFFDIDRSCRVDVDRAIYALGQIRNKVLTSLVLHRLMNGGTVAFRYLTQNGTYRESSFALLQSKQALRNALGVDTHISPE